MDDFGIWVTSSYLGKSEQIELWVRARDILHTGNPDFFHSGITDSRSNGQKMTPTKNLGREERKLRSMDGAKNERNYIKNFGKCVN